VTAAALLDPEQADAAADDGRRHDGAGHPGLDVIDEPQAQGRADGRSGQVAGLEPAGRPSLLLGRGVVGEQRVERHAEHGGGGRLRDDERG